MTTTELPAVPVWLDLLKVTDQATLDEIAACIAAGESLIAGIDRFARDAEALIDRIDRDTSEMGDEGAQLVRTHSRCEELYYLVEWLSDLLGSATESPALSSKIAGPLRARYSHLLAEGGAR